MPNITISIPQDIVDLLAKYKSQIVVSAVCQEALRRKLDILDILENREMGTTLTERLRTESEEYQEERQAEGRKWGAQWAQEQGSFELLVDFQDYVASRIDLSELEGRCDVHEFADGEDEERKKPFYQCYLEGWLAGAVEAFEKALP